MTSSESDILMYLIVDEGCDHYGCDFGYFKVLSEGSHDCEQSWIDLLKTDCKYGKYVWRKFPSS